jgi:hypothetical protein
MIPVVDRRSLLLGESPETEPGLKRCLSALVGRAHEAGPCLQETRKAHRWFREPGGRGMWAFRPILRRVRFADH